MWCRENEQRNNTRFVVDSGLSQRERAKGGRYGVSDAKQQQQQQCWTHCYEISDKNIVRSHVRHFRRFSECACVFDNAVAIPHRCFFLLSSLLFCCFLSSIWAFLLPDFFLPRWKWTRNENRFFSNGSACIFLLNHSTKSSSAWNIRKKKRQMKIGRVYLATGKPLQIIMFSQLSNFSVNMCNCEESSAPNQCKYEQNKTSDR